MKKFKIVSIIIVVTLVINVLLPTAVAVGGIIYYDVEDKKILGDDYNSDEEEAMVDEEYEYYGDEEDRVDEECEYSEVENSISMCGYEEETPLIEIGPYITYRTHVMNIGWQNWVTDGELAGTTGRSLRVEAMEIRLVNAPQDARIRYQTHVEGIGWQAWVTDGELAGTTRQSRRVEAIRIELENMPQYSIMYRAHIEGLGWQNWVHDGDFAGTTRQARRVEAIEVKLVDRIERQVGVSYKTHVANIGWQDWRANGQLAGTTGRSLRVEGMQVRLVNAPQNARITYQAHVAGRGWQNWVADGNFAGTTGQARSVEGIRIQLENMPGYSVMYRAHVQDIGWQNWVADGRIAGTTGRALRIEALEIRIVPQVGRGRMYIDTPTFSAFNRNNGIQIRGWEMSTTPNSRVEIFINDQRVNAGITRTHRQDVLDRITNFGGQSVNPTPGFQTNINISNLRLGRHRLRVEVVSLDGVVLDTREMNIHVHNVNIIDRGLTFVGPMDTRNRINRIIMHHTGMTVPQTVESIHNTHQNSNGWWGIGYHFYIRRNGNIYRGRPDNVIGGHARGHNFDSLGIAFEGNFNLEQMTPQQRASGQLLVAYLRDKYDIRTIQGHNEVNQTACPGRNFPWWIFR